MDISTDIDTHIGIAMGMSIGMSIVFCWLYVGTIVNPDMAIYALISSLRR